MHLQCFTYMSGHGDTQVTTIVRFAQNCTMGVCLHCVAPVHVATLCAAFQTIFTT